MAANETGNRANIEEITSYIRNLKLKTVALGGVDKDSALAAIQEIYHMFSNVYEGQSEQLSTQRNALAALRERQAPIEAELEQLKAEKESLERTVRSQRMDSGKSAELESQYRQRESAAKEEANTLRRQMQEQAEQMAEQMAELKRTHQQELELARSEAAEKDETLEEIYLDARRSRTRMLEEAQRDAEAINRRAQAEAEQLRESTEQEVGALRSQAEMETQALRSQVQQEAEALQSATAQEVENLRLTTDRELQSLRENAAQEAQELRENAEFECAQKQKEANQLVADAQAQAAQLLEEAQAQAAQAIQNAADQAEQIRREADAAAQESERECTAKNAAAEKTLSDARSEGQRIVDEAKLTYLQERRKYDSLLIQLGTLRAKTVQDIQADIDNLHSLVFGMAGRGIETDSMNSAGLSDMDLDSALMEAGRLDPPYLNENKGFGGAAKLHAEAEEDDESADGQE